MKKAILTICILIITTLFVKILGQEFGINVESSPVSTEEGTDGSIEVIIVQGEPEYIYFLYDSEPWQDGDQIRSSNPTYDNTYIFENLPAGRYFAGAIDNSGKSTFKEVFIYEPDE